MKYKTGDRVKVRSDLATWTSYGDDSVTEPMMPFKGTTVTIVSTTHGWDGNKYSIEGDDHNWTDEMFEGLAKGEGKMKACKLMVDALENPQKYHGRKCKVVDGAYDCEGHAVTELYIGTDGDFRSKDNGYRVYVGHDTELEEIPQPVSFMDAAKAMDRSAYIECRYKGEIKLYGGSKFTTLSGCNPVTIEEIVHGEWTIK